LEQIIKKGNLMNLCRALLVSLIFAIPAYGDSFNSTIDLFEASPSVKPFFENAYGYAVFATVGKGAIGIGGAYGKGQVYVDHKIVGTITLRKLSVGFQLGGQAFSEIIFLKDERAFNEFTGNTYEFDASASAVAITAGAQAQTGTVGDTAGASAGPSTGTHAATSYNRGTAVFVHALGGLMFEAAVGGQKFKYTPVGGGPGTEG
jgi:lipid-binding SYLF domain-containing protein